MKKLLCVIILLGIFHTTIVAQEYENWSSKGINEFYAKSSLNNGSLNEEGKQINFVFVPTKMKPGVYEVRIVDFSNDLYQIKNTDYYVTFRSYVGYWGYNGKAGILKVGQSSFSSKFYLKP